MRSFAALAILAAFSHCALGAEDFAFTYRGCINGTSIPNRVDVQFALYEKATGGSPLWSTTNSVMPSADGVFQCELAGEGLRASRRRSRTPTRVSSECASETRRSCIRGRRCSPHLSSTRRSPQPASPRMEARRGST